MKTPCPAHKQERKAFWWGIASIWAGILWVGTLENEPIYWWAVLGFGVLWGFCIWRWKKWM